MTGCSGDCSNCPMKDVCGTNNIPEIMIKSIQKVKESCESFKFKILILSGKGGVGKSTMTYLLARKFSQKYNVGVLDLDLCGPSLPFLFGVQNEKYRETALGIEPCFINEKISLMSTQFFLNEVDEALVANGTSKNSYVLQLLSDVDWGEGEVLLIDTPPGTSDEHISVCSFMSGAGIDGAVIVTTPEEVAISDVRREIRFCEKAGIKVLGVIENMSFYHCPECENNSYIYPNTSGGAEALCKEKNLKLLGKIPADPSLVAGITDKPVLSDSVKEAINDATSSIIGIIENKKK